MQGARMKKLRKVLHEFYANVLRRFGEYRITEEIFIKARKSGNILQAHTESFSVRHSSEYETSAGSYIMMEHYSYDL